MSRTRVSWSGDERVKQNMRRYGEEVKRAEREVALFFAGKIEQDARENAPWTDRTGNARQSLRAYVNDDVPPTYPDPQDLARDVVALYLSHGMDYGVYLEARWQGRYAVIMPTLQRYYPEIKKMLREIFS